MVVNSVSRMLKRFQDHRDMNAVNLPLPESLLTIVKEFASDKLNAHPTAQLIKELKFEYKPEEKRNGWSIYKPHRLTVTTAQGYFTQIWISPHGHIANQPFREFILTDFL